MISIDEDEEETSWVKIEPDLSDGKTLTVKGHFGRLSFAQGGVAVFHDEPFTKAVVVDLVNMELHESTETWLEETSIASRLVLRECGLTLSYEDLLKVVGPDFVRQRDAFFSEWK